MHADEEERIVKKAIRQPASFGVLFDSYYPKIYSYILRRTGNVEIARDITSVVFLKAYKGIHRFQWSGISISSWFYRIASNEVATYFRKEKYRPDSLDELVEIQGFDPKDKSDLEQEIKDAEQQLERHQEFLAIQKKIALLPVAYQEVISLRYFEHMPIKKIAAILNRKEGTVKSLLSRGLQKLREI